MRYVTAIVGALFIFVAVFILSALLLAMGPAWMRYEITIGSFSTNHPFGYLLSVLAATLSYRATLRHYAGAATR